MKNRMKINVAAVLLAVVMMCLVPVHAFAAGLPSLDEVRNAFLKDDSSINFSDYYFIYNTTRTQWGSTFDCVFYNLYDSGYEGDLFIYIDENSTPFGGNYVGMTYLNGEYKSAADAKVYNRQVWYNSSNGQLCGSASGYGCGVDMQYMQPGQMNVDFRFGSTNIPLFDSLDSAKSYFETGDTSGLLNGDMFQTYDSNIEVPQDLKVEFSAANLFDNDKGAMNLCDFNISWSQSEDVDLSNYQTEIYMQPTVKFIKAPYVGQHWQSQLGKKVLVSSSTTSVSNSVNISSRNLGNYFIDATAEVTSEGVVDGSVAYYNSPLYVYVRNVVGNKYSDWVKVTITPENVTTEGTKIFGNGSGVVSSGYEQIKGDSSKGGGVGEAIGGSSASDSSYGKGYYIDISDADLSSISGHLKSGFGILGDNGLLSLLRDFFSFIPDDYFTVLVTFISGCCAIGLLFLFLRR